MRRPGRQQHRRGARSVPVPAAGQNLSNAPEHVATAAIGYTPDIGNSGLSALFYLDGRLTSDFNTGPTCSPKGAGQLPRRQRPHRHPWPEQRWVDRSVRAEPARRRVYPVAFNAPFQGPTAVAGSGVRRARAPATGTQIFNAFPAEPRTYGITGRFRF
jgi:hypothetical protein